MTEASVAQNLARDRLFKAIVVTSTVLAICAMLGLLASLIITPEGRISLRWHWSILVWMGVGICSVIYVWNSVWAVTLESSPKARTKMKRSLALLLALSLIAFAYPLRFLLVKQGGAFVTGLLLAVIALSAAGLMIRWLVHLCEEQDKIELHRQQQARDSKSDGK